MLEKMPRHPTHGAVTMPLRSLIDFCTCIACSRPAVHVRRRLHIPRLSAQGAPLLWLYTGCTYAIKQSYRLAKQVEVPVEPEHGNRGHSVRVKQADPCNRFPARSEMVNVMLR